MSGECAGLQNAAMSAAVKLLKAENSCENCAIAIEDRQRVIRCQDCVFYSFGGNGVNTWGVCRLSSRMVDQAGYCYKAVRKEDEDGEDG